MNHFKTLSREEIKAKIIDLLVPFGVQRIGLFGSFARQDSQPPHDIDILVTLAKSGERKLIGMRWFVLDQELEQILGIPVDLVSEASLSPSLRAAIKKDLEIIYDQAG